MRHQEGYTTPEEAARGDIPAQYARAVASAVSPDGKHAAVVLATNEDPAVEMYEVVCFQQDGRWLDGGGSGGVGLGWTSTGADAERNLGVLRLSGQAPAGAVATIVSFRGREHRVAVGEAGYFLFASWDEPDTVLDDELPEPVRYVSADGSEARAPDEDRHAPDLRRLRRRMQALRRRHAG